MKYFIILFLAFIGVSVKAAVGCVGPDNTMYSLLADPGPKYKHNAGLVTLTSSDCYWNYIYVGGLKQVCEITGPPVSGTFYLANIPEECDIDTNVVYLLIGTLGLALFLVREKNNIAFSI